MAGKWASQITTSKHFYDITAHRCIQDICVDLGLKYVRGLSADMDDLLKSKGQQEAKDFFDYLVWSVAHDSFEPVSAISTDEDNTDTAIDLLARRLEYALEHKYTPPQNFYGIGGMKVFRDLIWLMQGMMRADHKFYKSHGQYDFPQKQWPKMIAMYGVGALLASPKLKAKAGSAMTDGMLMPYKKVLEKVEK